MNQEQLALLLRLVSLSDIDQKVLDSFHAKQITYLKACSLLRFSAKDQKNLMALDLAGYLSSKLKLSEKGLEIANVCKIRYTELAKGISLEERKKFYPDEFKNEPLWQATILRKKDSGNLLIPIFGDQSSLFKGQCPYSNAASVTGDLLEKRIECLAALRKAVRIDSRPVLLQAINPIYYKMIWFEIVGQKPQVIQAKYYDFIIDFYSGAEIKWQFTADLIFPSIVALDEKSKLIAIIATLNPKRTGIPERLK